MGDNKKRKGVTVTVYRDLYKRIKLDAVMKEVDVQDLVAEALLERWPEPEEDA